MSQAHTEATRRAQQEQEELRAAAEEKARAVRQMADAELAEAAARVQRFRTEGERAKDAAFDAELQVKSLQRKLRTGQEAVQEATAANGHLKHALALAQQREADLQCLLQQQGMPLQQQGLPHTRVYGHITPTANPANALGPTMPTPNPNPNPKPNPDLNTNPNTKPLP